MEEEQLKIRELLKKHNYKTSITISDKKREVFVEFPENILKDTAKKKMSVKYALTDSIEPGQGVLTVTRSSGEQSDQFFIPMYAVNALVLLDIISLCRYIGYANGYSFIYNDDGKELTYGEAKDFFVIDPKYGEKQAKLTALMISASHHNYSDDFKLIAQDEDIEEGYLLVQKFGRVK